jgi:hypothetical protein
VSVMRTNGMTHSTLIVGCVADAQRIGAMSNLDEAEYPHFHCGNLDAGILGQIFCDVSNGGQQSSLEFGSIEMIYSRSGEEESVFVHALPLQVSRRYARMSDAELDQCAARWFKANSYIRMPRSQEFDRRVMKELARLARLAIETDRVILVRTHYRGPHNKPLQPIARENARSG